MAGKSAGVARRTTNDLSIPHPRTKEANVSSQAAERGGRRRHADEAAADAQGNHHDVPERTPVIQPRKVEAVQSVVKPPVDAGEAFFLSRNRAARRVGVQP